MKRAMNVSSLYFCSFKKCQTLRTKTYSRGCLRNGGYCSICVSFLCMYRSQFSNVQVLSTDLLRRLFHRGKMTRTRWKTSERNQKGGKEQASGIGKRVSTALRTRWLKSYASNCFFYNYLEREVADEKCFEKTTKTFLVELIQTVISTVETRQTHRKMDSLRPHSHI